MCVEHSSTTAVVVSNDPSFLVTEQQFWGLSSMLLPYGNETPWCVPGDGARSQSKRFNDGEKDQADSQGTGVPQHGCLRTPLSACLSPLSILAEITSCLWSEHVDEYASGRRIGTNANSCHLQSTSRVPGTANIIADLHNGSMRKLW